MKYAFYLLLFLFCPRFIFAQITTQSIDTLSWLEGGNNSRLKQFLTAENEKTRKKLDYAVQRTNTEYSVKELGKFSSDRFEIDNKYFFKYTVLNERSSQCLLYKANILQDWDVLVNPEYLSASHAINLLDYGVSSDAQFLAFTYEKEGEKFLHAQVILLKDRIMQKDILSGLTSTELKWFKNGFFYHRATSGPNGIESSIWYHELGKEQEDDVKVFSRNKENNGNIGVLVPKDEKRIVFYDLGKSDNYFYKNDLKTEAFLPLKLRVKKQDDLKIIALEDTVVYALVNAKDGQRAFVKWNISQPKQMELVVDVFTDAHLLHLVRADDFFIGVYLEKSIEYIRLFDMAGELISEYTLPLGLSVSKVMDECVNDCVYFSLEGPTVPPLHWELNLKTKKIGNYGKTITDVDPTLYTTQAIPVPLSNGSEIWINVYAKRNHDFNAPARCIMELISSGNEPAQNSFDPALLHYIKEGGIYCRINFFSTASMVLSDMETAKYFNEVMLFLADAKVIKEGMVACLAEDEAADCLAKAIVERPNAYSAALLANGNIEPSLFKDLKISTNMLFIHSYVRQEVQITNAVKTVYEARNSVEGKQEILLKTAQGVFSNDAKSYEDDARETAEKLAFLMFYQAN